MFADGWTNSVPICRVRADMYIEQTDNKDEGSMTDSNSKKFEESGVAARSGGVFAGIPVQSKNSRSDSAKDHTDVFAVTGKSRVSDKNVPRTSWPALTERNPGADNG